MIVAISLPPELVAQIDELARRLWTKDGEAWRTASQKRRIDIITEQYRKGEIDSVECIRQCGSIERENEIIARKGSSVYGFRSKFVAELLRDELARLLHPDAPPAPLTGPPTVCDRMIADAVRLRSRIGRRVVQVDGPVAEARQARDHADQANFKAQLRVNQRLDAARVTAKSRARPPAPRPRRVVKTLALPHKAP